MMHPPSFLRLLILAVMVAIADAPTHAQDEAPKHISDNSFLIEEAYNQEPGVVQHIFNWFPTWNFHDGVRREFSFVYLMELPLGGQTHQFSFTPLIFEDFSNRPDGGQPERQGGWGDTFVNYRYQLSLDEKDSWVPAMAPRASMILPTGDDRRGLGAGQLGYQFQLPMSKELDDFAFHFNAGTSFFPNADVELAGGGRSPGHTLHGANVGGSVIWLASYDVNYLLEFVTFWEQELDNLGTVDNTTTMLLNPGVRTALYTGDEIQWVVGLGVPLGLSRDAPDVGLFVYLSVEHNFRKTK